MTLKVDKTPVPTAAATMANWRSVEAPIGNRETTNPDP
jgi:hypothetical protein